MPLNLSVPDVTELKPRITVIGVGGAGGNAVNNMIRSELDGVEFIVANTDAQAVGLSLSQTKIQLGTQVTQGLGAGSMPNVGGAAAEESLEEVMAYLEDANMVFITAGMGGGTGTGAAPVIAQAAKERGILTVGVVTKPFHFEGARRMRIAEEGIAELQKHVDTLLIIPNQNLFRIADDNTTFADAFAIADEVLHSGVRGITDLMIVPGLINLDFADVRSVMSEMGKAMMGTGEADGDKRAAEAAAAAISNPLLDEVSMKGARGVLINITGGMDMKLFEVDEAANRIRSEVDPEANIIVGSTFSHDLEGKMRVSVVATGIDTQEDIIAAATGNAIQRSATTAVPGLAASAPLAPLIKPAAPAALQSEALFQPQMQRAEVKIERPTASQPKSQAPAASRIERAPVTPAVPPMAKQPPVPGRIERTKPSVPVASAEQNPVGDVHDRIRRMLTEDAQNAPEQKSRSDNPFRQQAVKSPLNGMMGILKDKLGAVISDDAEPPRKPSRDRTAERAEKRSSGDLFDQEADEDLEIPAFLRRNSK